jgi:hypothetical protein
MFKTLVGCRLKGFGAAHAQTPRKVLLKGLRAEHVQNPRRVSLKGLRAEHVQNPRRVLLKGLRTWAHSLYDQKVLKTERFRHDFVMVLDGYQFREISRNREEP